jgi:pimeloyl-ACP methyl ester carboxylesterase
MTTTGFRATRWALLSLLLALPCCKTKTRQAPPPPEQKPAPPARPPARLEPYTLDLGDGKKLSAELGRVQVPESRRRPNGKKITLSFVRLKSTAARPGHPVVWVEGGPGVPAILLMEAVPSQREFLLKLRAIGDVIVFDQRGIGRSEPNLTCPEKIEWTDEALKVAFVGDRLYPETVGYARRCAEHWRREGVDLAAYNTVESADDIDDIRAAIGADKINLVGFSYGTHLTLATIRRHGDRVHRATIMGPAGPDHLRKLPSDVQLQLEKISALAKKDPAIRAKVPDLIGLMKRVLRRLEKKPISVELRDTKDSKPRVVKVGRLALEIITFADFGDTRDIPTFPLLYYSLSRGDTSVLARFVRKRFLRMSQGSAMPAVMRISSGASPERFARIEKELPDCIICGALDFPFLSKAYRDVWQARDLGDAFRSLLRSDVPLLIITGTLDGNAPPHRGEEIQAGFPNSQHLLVENAGHEDFQRPPVAEQILAFLRDGKATKTRLALPPLKFEPLPD